MSIKEIENLDRFILQSSTIRFHVFQELNKDFVLLHPFKSLIVLYSTQVTPPWVFPQALSPAMQEYLRKVTGT